MYPLFNSGLVFWISTGGFEGIAVVWDIMIAQDPHEDIEVVVGHKSGI